ncbi:unnamed protein product, partial [Mesorhabditis spiculigera]
MDFEAVRRASVNSARYGSQFTRPVGEILKRALADRVRSMGRFDAYPEIENWASHENVRSRWAERWDRVEELKTLPFKYVFNPNRPPTVGDERAWPFSLKTQWDAPSPKSTALPTPQQKAFIDAHAFYERAFRYLIYWQLRQKQFILHLLIDDLLAKTKAFGDDIPAYPIFVMGNGDHFGALLVLWKKESLGFDPEVPLLRGPGFTPIQIIDAALHIDDAHHYGKNTDDEWSHQLRQKWDDLIYPDLPDCYTGVMMVHFSELRPILQKIADRLRVFIKMGDPQLGDYKIQLDDVQQAEKMAYEEDMQKEFDKFWNSRKIIKVADVKVEELKREIIALQLKRDDAVRSSKPRKKKRGKGGRKYYLDRLRHRFTG